MHPVECTCNRCNGMDLTQFTPGNEVAVAQKDAQIATLKARVTELEARLAASLEQQAAVERLYAELHSQWKPIIDAQLRAATEFADGAKHGDR